MGNVFPAGLCLVVFECLKISPQLWQHVCVQAHDCDGGQGELASSGAGKLHWMNSSCVSSTQHGTGKDGT